MYIVLPLRLSFDGLCMRPLRSLVFGLALLAAGDALAGTASLLDRPDLGLSLIHFEGQISKGDLQRIKIRTLPTFERLPFRPSARSPVTGRLKPTGKGRERPS